MSNGAKTCYEMEEAKRESLHLKRLEKVKPSDLKLAYDKLSFVYDSFNLKDIALTRKQFRALDDLKEVIVKLS